MSAATWTPRTEREREAVVALVRKAQSRAWDASKGIGPDDWQGLVCEPDVLVPYVAITPRPTRLREYKGVTYDASRPLPWRYGESGTSTAAHMIHWQSGVFTDADHAALMDLKANPTEPVPDAVVEAIREWRESDETHVRGACESFAATVRAIVRGEMTQREHVAALEAMGAAVVHGVESLDTAANHYRYPQPRSVMFLPPEAST